MADYGARNFNFGRFDGSLETARRAKATTRKSCERCGDPIIGPANKRFCGSCLDIRAEERRRANYLNRKASTKNEGRP